MSTPELPPEVAQQLASLKRDVADLQRRSERNAPAIGGLADVDGNPMATGDVLAYDKTTGRWGPGESDAYIAQVSWSASPVLPPGRWLEADGQAVSRTTYAALFAEIGTTYGVGNGSTTFNLPNLVGRVVEGVGTMALAAVTGARTVTLGTGEMPSHSHAQNVTAGFPGPSVRSDYDADESGSPFAQGINTGATGGGGAHNNMQPTIALWAYIRY